MTKPTTALRALRETRGLTQRELAHRAGITNIWLSRLERGHAPKSWQGLSRLADVLAVTTDNVLGRGEPPAEPVDAVSRQDRELLRQMREYAESILTKRVLKLTGGWRPAALSAWLGGLWRIRDHGLERPALPPAQGDEAGVAQRRHQRPNARRVRA